MTTDTNEIIEQCCNDKEPVTTLDHAKAMRACAGRIVADLETIEGMLPFITQDNPSDAFITVADNLNHRIHTNTGHLINHYLQVEREIVSRINT